MDIDATRLNAAGAAVRAASDGLAALKAFEPRSSGGSSKAKAVILTEAEAALAEAEAEYEAALTEWETAEMRRLAGLPPPATADHLLVELLP